MRGFPLPIAVIMLSAGGVAMAAKGPHLQISSSPATALQLPPGITHLDQGALAYRPAALPAGSHPLLVLLHGAGEPPGMLLEAFRAAADQRGLILLAPKAAGETWDSIEAVNRLRLVPTGSAAETLFDGDTGRVETAMRDVLQRAPIATGKIGIAGHSDGASYALSLGMWNPRLFRGIIALSPGGLLAPDNKLLTQRIFIAHGRSDRVVPIQHDQETIVDPLTSAGVDVRFRPFDGGHGLNQASVSEGLGFVLPK